MISNGASADIARAISPISGARLPASLRTGTTTEIRGAAPEESELALVIVCPAPARVLWGDQRPGNLFDPGGRRSRQGVHLAVRRDDKAEPAPREPVAHPQR